MDNITIAREIKEQIIDRLAEIQPVMLDEPQAFKKACIRLGYDMAVAEEITPVFTYADIKAALEWVNTHVPINEIKKERDP